MAQGHLASDYFRSLVVKPKNANAGAKSGSKATLDAVGDDANKEPLTAPVDDQLTATVTGKVPESAVTDDVTDPVATPDPLDTADPGVDPDVLQDAADYASADLDLQVAAAMHAFAETADIDLDDGETLADRLQALLIGVVDPDFNGDIDEDESDLIAVVMNSAADYLADKGVSDDDIDALLNNGDADAAERVQELLSSKLPSDADGIASDIDGFAFNDDDDDDDDGMLDSVPKDGTFARACYKDNSISELEKAIKAPADKADMKEWNLSEDEYFSQLKQALAAKKDEGMDSVVLDATITAIRGGKKVRIKKRMSGRVRLSAKQKLAIRKMLKKSHSAKAQMRRLKSLRIHERTIPAKGK